MRIFRNVLVPIPCSLREQLLFEMCLFACVSAIGEPWAMKAVFRMRDMTIANPSLLPLALRNIGRSPRTSFYILTYLLTLPESILRDCLSLQMLLSQRNRNLSEQKNQIACCQTFMEVAYLGKTSWMSRLLKCLVRPFPSKDNPTVT